MQVLPNPFLKIKIACCMRINRINSRATLFALMLLLFISESFQLYAQGKPGVVKGVVLDGKGEPLSGVSVIARNTKTNFTTGTSTDNSGTFTFPRMTAGGPYSFTFSTVGFE